MFITACRNPGPSPIAVGGIHLCNGLYLCPPNQDTMAHYSVRPHPRIRQERCCCTGLLPSEPAHPLLQRRSISFYWPFILEDISALCSWKRSARRAWVAIVFCTQRATQPFSRDETALDVKSSTQDMKQLSTRLPKSYTHEGEGSLSVRFPGGQGLKNSSFC